MVVFEAYSRFHWRFTQAVLVQRGGNCFSTHHLDVRRFWLTKSNQPNRFAIRQSLWIFTRSPLKADFEDALNSWKSTLDLKHLLPMNKVGNTR